MHIPYAYSNPACEKLTIKFGLAVCCSGNEKM